MDNLVLRDWVHARDAGDVVGPSPMAVGFGITFHNVHGRRASGCPEGLAERRRLAAVTKLGSGQGHSMLEVIEPFGRVSGQAIPYVVTKRRSGDAAITVADTTATKRQLG